MRKKDKLLTEFKKYKLLEAVQCNIKGGIDKAPTWCASGNDYNGGSDSTSTHNIRDDCAADSPSPPPAGVATVTFNWVMNNLASPISNQGLPPFITSSADPSLKRLIG
jgi:hypothetical protein